jgi:formamidopyrimidine-DNA glycosylase
VRVEALYDHPLLADIGPEPLGNEFNEAMLADALTGRKTPIKAALLDQTIVAGLGNIYVCEALFQSGISPVRLSHTVPGKRTARLVPAIRDVLTRAIEVGGSSLRDFVQVNGELGYFQHAWQVYGREGEPCRACARPVLRIVQSGRSTFYCSHCQR